MTEPTNRELQIMLGNLSENMEKGFKGVYHRLDITNGNVKRNSEFRLRATGAIAVIGFIGFGNIIFVLLVFLGKI